MSTPSILVDLPPIFWDTTASAPIRQMQRPYLDRDADGNPAFVCATNAIVCVQMPAELLRPDVLATLRPRKVGVPNVDRHLQGWIGDGRSHRLPAWDDGDDRIDDREDLGPRSAVRVGWTPLFRRWVTFLLCHGIRVVHTGISPDDPVRFDFLGGEAEGLLMPCLVKSRPRRHPWKKGL